MTDEEHERTCFTLISLSGAAKSDYIRAIELAREDRFDEAEASIAQGDERLLRAHGPHARIVQREASGLSVPVDVLLLHAEDQLSTAETFKVMAREFVMLYRERAGS